MNQLQPNLQQMAERELAIQPQSDFNTPANALEFIDQDRDVKDFRKAAKHSSQVERLKLILPIIGLVIIALVLGALIFQPKLPVNITIGDSGIEDGKLVMNNPKLDGFDPNNRAYSVEAEKAIQSVENPTLVELINIKANVPMADGLSADIVAGNGSFDATQKKLELGGSVNVVTNDGMKLNLQDAYFDLKKGTMNTYRSIDFTSKTADISSQSLEIFENGDLVVFSDNVKLTIRPKATE